MMMMMIGLMYSQRVVLDRSGSLLQNDSESTPLAVTTLCYRSTERTGNVKMNFQLSGSEIVNGDVGDIDDNSLKTDSQSKSSICR